MTLGRELAQSLATIDILLLDVPAVALLWRNGSFAVVRREPFKNPLHSASASLANLCIDMLNTGVFSRSSLLDDPEESAEHVLTFARSNADGSTVDVASHVLAMRRETLVLALPTAMNSAWRAITFHTSNYTVYDYVAEELHQRLTNNQDKPEVAALITRKFVNQVRRERHARVEIVPFAAWLYDLPDDMLERRDKQMALHAERLAGEMERVGQVQNGRFTQSGLARLNLNQDCRQ